MTGPVHLFYLRSKVMCQGHRSISLVSSLMSGSSLRAKLQTRSPEGAAITDGY